MFLCVFIDDLMKVIHSLTPVSDLSSFIHRRVVSALSQRGRDLRGDLEMYNYDHTANSNSRDQEIGRRAPGGENRTEHSTRRRRLDHTTEKTTKTTTKIRSSCVVSKAAVREVGSVRRLALHLVQSGM